MKRHEKILLPVASIATVAAGVLLVYAAGLFVSLDDLIARIPFAPAARLAVTLLLFLLQGIVPFFWYGPIAIACGMLFDGAMVFFVGVFGTALSLIPPYLIGRMAPEAWVRTRLARCPQIWKLAGGEKQANFLLSYFMRSVGLSNKALGLFFGLLRMPFFPFLISGLLGTLPSLAGYLLLGQSWTLKSPWMWAAFLINMLAVGALVIRFRGKKARAHPDK